ncbi:hypothetical protein LJR277_002848 [Pseudomonas sp. LjRoot277]
MIKSFEQAFQTHYTAFEIGKITAIRFDFAAVSMLLRALYTGRSGNKAWHIALPRWCARCPSASYWRSLLQC